MKTDFLKVLLIFAICLVLAFGLLVLSACLFDRVEPLASAETVTLPADGVVGDNLLFHSDLRISSNYPLFFSYTTGVSFDSSNRCTVLSAFSLTSQWQVHLSSSIDNQIQGVPVVLSFYSNIGLYTLNVSNISNTNYASSFVYLSNGWAVRFRRANPDQVLFIQILRNNASSDSLSLYWFKLELGNQFTGYVPNYDEIQQNTLSDYFDYNDGWTNYSVMGDFLHNNQQLQYLSSPNGGTITYTSSGTLLESSANGTQFVYSPNQFEAWSQNSDYTVAILINGTITTGDVVLTLKYSQYTSYNEYWQGSDPVALSDQYNLSSGLSLYYLSANGTANMTLTLRSGVSIYLLAYKVETGSIFTRFPYSVVSDQSSFSNGYNAGVIAGTEQGYSQGVEEGYDSGYREGYDRGEEVFYPQGYTNGYNDGVLTADQGDWTNVLTALINLPVTFIMSLISFEVLGFNFSNVFRIIILFSLFSFIISKVIKGVL